jgi:hypothetical protein
MLFALLAVGVVSVEEYRVSKLKREAAADHAKMFQALTDLHQQQQALLQNALKLKEVYKLQEMARLMHRAAPKSIFIGHLIANFVTYWTILTCLKSRGPKCETVAQTVAQNVPAQPDNPNGGRQMPL